MSTLITALQSVFTMFFGAPTANSEGGVFYQAFDFLTSEDVLPYVVLVIAVGFVSLAFGKIRSLIKTA